MAADAFSLAAFTQAELLKVAGASAVLGYGLYTLLKDNTTIPANNNNNNNNNNKAFAAVQTAANPVDRNAAAAADTAASSDDALHAKQGLLPQHPLELPTLLTLPAKPAGAAPAPAPAAAAAAAPATSRVASTTTSTNSTTTTTTTTSAVVARVAAAGSDVAFLYATGTFEPTAQLLLQHAAAGRRNLAAHVPTVKTMDVRAGAGTAVAGAVLAATTNAATTSTAAGALVTVVAPSDALPQMAPALHVLARAQRPLVLHVPLQHVDSSLRASHDTTALALLKDSGFAVLASEPSAVDAHDVALLSHILAAAASLPVLHAFDGVRAAHVQQSLPAADSVLDLAFADQGRGEAALRAAIAEAASATATPTSANASTAAVNRALGALQTLTGRPQNAFTYYGSMRATAVLVVLAPLAPALAAVAEQLNSTAHFNHRVGVLAVRVLRPWAAYDFVQALPRGVERLAVLEAGERADGSLLLSEVAAAVAFAWSNSHVTSGPAPSVSFGRVLVDGRGVTPAMAHEAFERLLLAPKILGVPTIRHPTTAAPLQSSVAPDNGRRVAVVWQRTQQQAAATSQHLLAALRGVKVGDVHSTNSSSSSINSSSAAVLTTVDAFSAGGIARTEAVVGPQAATALAAADQPGAHVVSVQDVALLTTLSEVVTRQLVAGGTLLLLEPPAAGTGNDAAEEVATALGADALAAVQAKGISVRVMSSAAGSVGNAKPRNLAQARELQLRLQAQGTASPLERALPLIVASLTTPTTVSLATPASTPAASLPGSPVRKAAPLVALPASSSSNALLEQQQQQAWARASAGGGQAAQPFHARVPLQTPSGSTSTTTAAAATTTQQVSLAETAWRLLYNEAYGTGSGAAARAEHTPGELYRLRLTKNERLTPADYHRHIFHLEMDIRGTGLTYAIGDALGVYGQNDAAEVDAFLRNYGVEPAAVLSVQQADGRRELATAATLFRERLDIFGKPSQKFYGALAPYATDSFQRLKLEWLGTDDKEGVKLRQLESVTFADVLAEFDSARPPLDVLVSLLPDIKPRHYSIASSMKMCPDSVHLLVVLVDWETPKGRKRYGQCTRYLANLDPASSPVLTVDIKPSAMHLPKDPRQPVIMAGLGTGMAPFRAFLQERQWQKQQGLEVGPMLLYFGSRHRSEEYLYGDYLDQMHAEGLLTRLGLAFSRDQPEKIYIQHRIAEDQALVTRYLQQERGHFYLCGPTWPVPDIKQALLEGVMVGTGEEGEGGGGLTPDEAEAWLEELKEQGRYVLEVY